MPSIEMNHYLRKVGDLSILKTRLQSLRTELEPFYQKPMVQSVRQAISQIVDQHNEAIRKDNIKVKNEVEVIFSNYMVTLLHAEPELDEEFYNKSEAQMIIKSDVNGLTITGGTVEFKPEEKAKLFTAPINVAGGVSFEKENSLYPQMDFGNPLIPSIAVPNYSHGDIFADYMRYTVKPSNNVGMNKEQRSIYQDWVLTLPFMQQAVISSGIRAMDGWPKLHDGKHLIRWFRRAVMLSSFEGEPILTPYGTGGGSFTGSAPFTISLREIADRFLEARDPMPMHYFNHAKNAFQIVGYKHSHPGIRGYFYYVYERMCNTLHAHIETQDEMDLRLCDNEKSWRDRADEFTCTD